MMPSAFRGRSFRFWRFFLVFSAFLVLAVGLSAQVDTGVVSGLVMDSSGASVAGATVTLTNTGTNVILKTTTDPGGHYQFSAVHIGLYTVTVEARGFAKVTQENAQLAIQQNLVVDFTLKPGTLSETVEVSAAPPPLQTQDASVGGVVEAQQINDLPLNGRNYTFLAQLNAGVTFSQQDSRGLGSSGSFAANGTAANQNNYLLDGVDNNSNLVDFLNGNSYIYRPAVDALQEFKVQTGDFSAEFGRAAGAVLNATIKSGTDKYHGTIWEFFRNDGLDAANFFENANNTGRGRFQQNQFGGAFGGPIPLLNGKTNKTFFFADYEGLRINQATPYVSTVPTELERSSGYTNFSQLLTQGGTQTDALGNVYPLGQIFDPATTRCATGAANNPSCTAWVRSPFPGNILPANRLDQNVINVLNTYPLPTNGNLFNNYASDPIFTESTNQGDFRVDEVLGQHDQLFGRYSRANDIQNIPGPFSTIANGGGFNTGNQTNISQNSVLGWTHIFSPTLLNEARFGFARVDTQRIQPYASDTDIPEQFGIGGIPDAPNNGGLPTYTISGLTELGASPWQPTHETNTTYQLTENLTKVVGKHSFKGGFEFQHVDLVFFQPAYSRGSFDYDGEYTEVPGYTDGNTGIAQLLLTPTPSTVGGPDYVGGTDQVNGSNIATPRTKRNYYALYGQDDYRVTNKLTLNLGLRWEYFGHGVAPAGAALNFLPETANENAQLLMPNSTCHANLFSPSVIAALATDNIGVTCTGNQALVESDKADFAPRIGFAYQATPRFVVRSAFGIFYGSTVNGDNLVDAINYPFSYTETYNTPGPGGPITYPNGSIGTFENGLSAFSFSPTSVPAAGVGFTGTDYHFHTPSTLEYNLSIQYQVTANSSFTAGYVGTQGRHLQIHTEYNTPEEILVPQTNPQPYVQYPNFARGFTQNATEANSGYNALQLTYQYRFSHGFNMLANYTYSRCLTDARDILVGTIGSYRAPQLPGFGIHGDYALCDFDVKQIFHLSGGYDLPVGHGQWLLTNASGLTNALLGGWKTNFILTLQDGQPFTVPCNIQTTADFGCNALVVPGVSLYGPIHNNNQWMNPAAFTNPAVAATNGQTDYSPLGGGATQLYGPGFHRLDFSLFKEFAISEDKRFEFRTEFFNLTNHPNFGNPGFSAPGIAAAPGALNFSSNEFGQILGTRDGASDQREIQFALKFYF
jgi:Carboxypeptidase regulatory-like domain/TonB-dependent Receptor Plug Domain/TonB dependent receptor